ncbi:hypothetical protein GCM10017708_02770 [Arthrobacter citreus]
MAPKLHPELSLAVEAQENLIEPRRKDEAGSRDMLRAAVPAQRGVPRGLEEPQIWVPLF